MTMNETELSYRWGLSPKTLQRWRCEGRGPKYWKLSKRVVYPINEVIYFENNALYESTSDKAYTPPDLHPPVRLYSSREAANVTGFPMYYFTHPQTRKAFRIPHLYVGKVVRFDPNQLRAWCERHVQEIRKAELDDDSSNGLNEHGTQSVNLPVARTSLM
jgi:hypothetical protein